MQIEASANAFFFTSLFFLQLIKFLSFQEFFFILLPTRTETNGNEKHKTNEHELNGSLVGGIRHNKRRDITE